MADETEETGTDVEGGAGEAGASRRDPHLERTIRDRDGWKQKHSAAAAELAEYKAREGKQAEDAERAAGDWTKVETRYQKRIAELEAENGTLSGAIAERDKGERRKLFAQTLATEGAIPNVRAIERLLPTLGLDDDAPEAPGKSDIKEALKRLQADVPELFTKSTATKPPPGKGERHEEGSDDFYRALAKARSSGGPGSAYDKARGG